MPTYNKTSPAGTLDRPYKKEYFGQGYIYKNYENFKKKKGVCYIPELSDEEYTYQDFVELCGGNEEVAKYVFEVVDWQHPETFIEELADIGISACESCGYLYDTLRFESCPKCNE